MNQVGQTIVIGCLFLGLVVGATVWLWFRMWQKDMKYT